MFEPCVALRKTFRTCFEVLYPEYLETQSTIERIKYFINN